MGEKEMIVAKRIETSKSILLYLNCGLDAIRFVRSPEKKGCQLGTNLSPKPAKYLRILCPELYAKRDFHGPTEKFLYGYWSENIRVS